MKVVQGRKKSAIIGAIVDFGGSIIIMVTGLYVTPRILHYMSDANYGFWMTIMQVVGLLGLLEMGASIAVTQRVANPALAENRDALSRFMSSALVVQLGTMVFIMCLGLLMQKQLFEWFKIKESGDHSAGLAYTLMVIWFSISIVFSLMPALLGARQKIGYANFINFLSQFFGTLGLLPLLAMGLSLKSFPIAQAIAGITGAILAFVWIKRFVPSFTVSPTLVGPADIASIFKFSIFNWFAKIGFVVLTACDNILIAASLGPASVTMYIFTTKLATMVAPNMARLSSSTFPGFSELYALKDTQKLQKVVLFLTRFSTRMACLGAILISVCTERFVNVWVGPKYFVGGIFIIMLSVIAFRDTIIRGIGVVVIGSGDMKGFGIINLVEAAFKIGLALLFMVKMNMGLNGLLLGQIIGTFIVSGTYFPAKICTLTKMSLRTFVYQGFVLVLVKSFPTIAFVGMINWLVPATWGWSALVIIAISAILINFLSFEFMRMRASPEIPFYENLISAIKANIS